MKSRNLSRRAFLALGASAVTTTMAPGGVAQPRSYYAPEERTTYPLFGQFWTPLNPPQVIGRPVDCVVMSDYAKRTYAFIDGNLAWIRDSANSWPRSASIFEGNLFVVEGPQVIVINPKTGDERRRIDIPGFHAAVNAIDVRYWGGEVVVTLSFDRGGTTTWSEGESVHCLTLTAQGLEEFYRCPVNSVHPRHAEWGRLGLIVSDTFGGAVRIVDPMTSRIVASTDVYFPNTATLLDDDTILICSEHGNRIFRWDPRNGQRFMVFSAPVWPFTNLEIDGKLFSELELNTADPQSKLNPKISKCAEEVAGEYTLYSPNSAIQNSGRVIVSDCDNHRVIVLHEGVIQTIITGFNNPVNAVFI